MGLLGKDKKDKPKIGRPTKYEEWMCARVIEMMMDGEHKCAVASDLGICEDTLYEWAKSNPAFSEAIKKGETYSKAYWERKLSMVAMQPAGKHNATALIFMMKAKFAEYRDPDKAVIMGNGAESVEITFKRPE